MARILMALSGGVDSAVAAALLREAGHDLIGVTLHLWDEQGDRKVGRCCAPEDRDDARRVCEHLGIPHYVLDERAAFRAHVVDPFVRSYGAGETPIPCVHCNRTVKLAHLVGVADEMGASLIATGHYARTGATEHGPVLLRGIDRDKDQSYFLFGVPRGVLPRLHFPLGDRTKAETRAEGRRLGVPVADKPDSQELCFVPDGDVGGFVARAMGGARTGKIKDETGATVGEHAGIAGFTIGQRRGLGLGGGPARYVLQIVGERDEVIVGPSERLASRTVSVRDVHWQSPPPTTGAFTGEVRVRYRHVPARARIEPTEDGFVAEFAAPQRAITPGQAAVVYRGDEVVGGGFIA